ncbi:hypothetical protein HDU76_004106 [Blyttiomyces sp. JEL0837]|nr:hypothetical protein HDU76_004106 [Blyttiomyces sp. JEL0837]
MREPINSLLAPQDPSSPRSRQESLIDAGGKRKESVFDSGNKRKESVIDGGKRKESIIEGGKRKESTIRSQKEKDLARDIKLVLRADAWNKLPDLLADWEIVSNKDIMVECGIQFLQKERAMCEKILEWVKKRGPLKNNEYPFASALLHLADCQYYLSKWDECIDNLRLGISYIESYIKQKESEQHKDSRSTSSTSPSNSSTAVGSEWLELKDWGSVFLAVMWFRKANYEETLRLLDKTANYEMAKSLYRLGHADEALKALNRRQSQEEALSQIGIVKKEDPTQFTSGNNPSSKTSHGPSTTSSTTTSRRHTMVSEKTSSEDVRRVFSNTDISENGESSSSAVDSAQPIHACHDLHILLLMMLNKTEEAKDLYMLVKGGGTGSGSNSSSGSGGAASKKQPNLKEFAKRLKFDEIGKSLIDSWIANPNELARRM